MLKDQPPRPANMENIVAINQGRKPYTEGRADIPLLSPGDAAGLIKGGYGVVDVRSHDAYAAGHVPGATSVTIASSSFEQNLGWIVSDDRPFVLVGDTPRHAPIAARKLAFVGLDRRAEGYVLFDEWAKAGLPVSHLSQIEVHELSRDLATGQVRLLDVRERSEWDAGHIASSFHTNFKHLSQFGDALPIEPHEPVAVICAGGMRSATACGLLRERGFRQVHNVRGGISAWRAAGLPLVRP